MLFKWIPAGARALLLGKAHFALRLAEAKVAVTLTADAEPETPGNDGDVRMERIPLHFPLDKADRESCGEMLRSAACDAVVADGLEGAVTPEKLHELVREIELALSSSGTAVVLLDGASSTKTLSPEFVIALFERFGFALAERKSAGDRGSLISTALVFVRDAARVRARKSLQGLLEEDRMTTTYKLALIKALAEINLDEWMGGWVSIVGGVHGRPTAQQFNKVCNVLQQMILANQRSIQSADKKADDAVPAKSFNKETIISKIADGTLIEKLNAGMLGGHTADYFAPATAAFCRYTDYLSGSTGLRATATLTATSTWAKAIPPGKKSR